ncbi:hypothetical protein [Streptomyces sp. RKAG337]|uniref:hypothetical protein n=1 Tax=Streptomyces sp. RKAG337 TaxID=2893404 RepID=UPI00203370C5|nr:hypothetical protein [Streptomyces sp. RKAG337]MCM2427834.1 hypothetical protein [Streptomyces sp. RKAG337]
MSASTEQRPRWTASAQAALTCWRSAPSRVVSTSARGSGAVGKPATLRGLGT